MAISVTLDVVPDSAIDTPSSSLALPSRFVRAGTVNGIDVSVVAGSPKYEAMFQAQQAVVAADAASPLTNYPGYVLRRILLSPLSDTSAKALLIYETVVFGIGVPPSTYVLADDAFLTTRTTSYVPGSRQKITVAWDPPPSKIQEEGIAEDAVEMSILFPMRTLTVSALIYGYPTFGQDKIGYTNNAAWPTAPTGPITVTGGTLTAPLALTVRGFDAFAGTGMPSSLPKGYWLLSRYATAQNRIGGYYQLEAQAITRVVEDWSECGMLKNLKTGKFVDVGDTIAKGDTIITNLFSTAYSYGVTRGTDPDDGSRNTGVVRVGPYKLADFTAIFGF